MRFARVYFLVLQALGVVLAIGVAVFAIFRGIDAEIGLLSLVGIMAAWLRFNLEPIGYFTLTPVVSFVAMLLYAPYVPVLVTSLSAIIGSRFFGPKEWDLILPEAGEESLSMMLSVGVFQFVMSYQATGGAFLVAVGAYVLLRVMLLALRGKLQEDIALAPTVLNAGRYFLGNVLVLAIVAFVVTRATPIYSRFGLLGLSLVTIALAEFYRPWKLLSQQADDLYTSLAIIAEAIDVKDPYTGRHSRRVAEMATKLARRLRLPEHEVNTVRIGAILHDIGKIGVSGSIIRKPAPLESNELKAMQRHPVISADIMEPVEYFKEAALLVRHHHEHYDGTGYPDGLEAEEIPIGSRIILVADAFDAMTTDRPYREGKASQEALRILRERAGRQFDARVVKVLQEIITEVAISEHQGRTK